PSSAPAQTSSSPPRPEPVAVVRFACDEKYVGSPECDEARWIAETTKDPWSSSLLDHDDGGPEGAIWNGNAPMYLITRESVRAASVGSTPLKSVAASGFRWFRIPTATWRGAMRSSRGHAYRAASVLVNGAKVGELWYAEGE